MQPVRTSPDLFSTDIKKGKHLDANKSPCLQWQLMDCRPANYEHVSYLSHPKHPGGHQSQWPYLDGINFFGTRAEATFWNLTVNEIK
jgi:hypothetical protein